MPRLSFPRWLLAATFLMLATPALNAEPIPWTYSTFVYPNFVTPDAPTGIPSPFPTYPYGPPVGVGFQGTSNTMAGSSPIVLANLWTSGFLYPGDSVTFKKQPIPIGMGILDQLSNRSQIVLFTAYLNGTLTGQGSNLTLSFAERSKTVHIGKHNYKIDLGPIVMPGPPSGGPIGATGGVRPYGDPYYGNSGGGYGAIGATVKVTNNPEPSTLVLVGIGGSVASLLYYRRRRTNPPETVG